MSMQMSSAAKQLRLMVALLSSTLAFACNTSYTPQSINTGDFVSIKDGRLGWSGIFLNETRSNVEKQIGNRLEVHDQAFPACGQYASQIVLNERKVTLQWSGLSMDAAIDSIYVDLTISEYTLPPAMTARQIITRLPHLEWTAINDESSLLNSANGDDILIKNGSDNFLLVSPENCLD